MRSIRERLTWGFVAGFALVSILLGISLYTDRRATILRQLDDRLAIEVELVLAVIKAQLASRVAEPGDGKSQAQRATTRDTVPSDSIPLISKLETLFQGYPHYLVVIGAAGRPLLTIDPAVAREAVERGGRPSPWRDTSNFPVRQSRLLDSIGRATLQSLWETTSTEAMDTTLGSHINIRYRVGRPGALYPDVRAVVIGASVEEFTGGSNGLVRSMLLVAPVMLVAAFVVGHWIAGTGLRPVESMVEELKAITDGRSLHRRLPVDPSATDELARLANAVNGMFARLETSFHAQQRFVAEASHELKTPLMVVRAGVERALTNPGPESLQPLDESLREINRMTELVDSLLVLARADEGRAPLAVEECDLRDLAHEAAETAHILAESKDVEIRVAIPETPVILPVDRSRVRQLLLNLVTNAVKYTHRGEIAVILTDSPETVQLMVRDTGIGIADSDVPHIFDRFWRADPSRSRSPDGYAPGTGLGLAITKWIAEAHGGTISVQSLPGKGTIFTVSLPKPRTRKAPATG